VVFLDEIGDADPKTQVQLLRFLDNGSFVRLGENKTRFSHVLLVAATNKNLPELIRKGVFREDLFHRLSELTLEIPSLNERREDIPDLSTHFIGKLHRAYKNPGEKDSDPPVLDAAARQLLQNHHYTGNMRELRSVLLRALFFRRSESISAEEIRRAIGNSLGTATSSLDAADAQGKIHAELAQRVFTSIISGGEDFWSALYTPYSNNDLPRAAVIACIELARSQGATTMPAIAGMLKACDPTSTSERKTFFRFKNFLYKTIRIT
ncbi:MAG: sigma 54-interacting transcriptional regulator, partial [Desulfuromonas sp.]